MQKEKAEEEEWLKEHKYPMPGSIPPDPDSVHQAESSGKALTVKEYMDMMETKGFVGIADDYVVLKLSDREGEDEDPAFNKEANRRKCRYNMELLESTRVKLKDDLPGDFIHASFVDGYQQKNTYISTQAPSDRSMVDFWRMVWQESVGVIVMLTKFYENGEAKASLYWPQRAKGKIRYGPFQVTNCSVSERSTYVLTELAINNLMVGEKRMLTHFLYLDWPDHCVPLLMEGFCHFMERVRQMSYTLAKKAVEHKYWSRAHPPPIVVHCSAGIGRTGTWEAIDICYRRLIHRQKLDIVDVIKKMRTQRAGSIQTNVQFIFIHLVLLHLINKELGVDTTVLDPRKIIGTDSDKQF